MVGLLVLLWFTFGSNPSPKTPEPKSSPPVVAQIEPPKTPAKTPSKTPRPVEPAPPPPPEKKERPVEPPAVEPPIPAPRTPAIVAADSVVYPAHGQKDVPLSFSGGPEVDDPLAGFPVSLQFGYDKSLTDIEAHLADDRGNRIGAHVSTPDAPLPGVRRPGLVGMIPQRQLSPNSIYRARVAGMVDGERFERIWEFTTEDDGDADGSWANKMVDRLNRIRRQADLAPVVLDDSLSQSCRAHAKYLVVNARRPEVQGMGAHDEDPRLPGFTPEGRKAAKASDIAIGDDEPLDALDGWMATLYHRIPLLEPNLRRVGFGCARGAQLGWVTMLDVASGRDPEPRLTEITYPVADQIDVPLHFPPGGETPNPIPDDTTGRAGYPITLFFPFNSPLLRSRGTLVDTGGKAIPCWFSSPETPANPKYPRHQGTTVCLIPKSALRPGETYRVTFAGTRLGDAWSKSWSFTTAKSDPGNDAVAMAVDRFNAIRRRAGLPTVTLDAELSKGCQAHADYLVRNSDRRSRKGFSVIDEDPSFPGFTEHGQHSSRRSDVFSLSPRTTKQMDDLIGTLYRRSFLLDPRLRRIGLGCAYEPGQGWINVLDLNSGRDS